MKSKLRGIWKWFLKDQKCLIIGGILMVVLIALGIYISKKNTSKVTYQTSQVEKRTIVSIVSASGIVVSANTINITTSVAGVVKSVFVKDGDQVYFGQKIMEIIPDSASNAQASSSYASYISSKNAVESARLSIYTLQSSEFAANQKFINDAVARNLSVTDPTYIQQYADWKAAEGKYLQGQNAIDQANASLSSSWNSYKSVSPIIYTPMTGTITNLTYPEGINITGTLTRVAVIKVKGNPLASFNVSEIDINKIKPGQKATITVDSISDKTFTGVVKTIDRIGTTTSGVTNYPVVIAFDTEIEGLLPNMSTSVNIILETKVGVLSVPSTAVHSQNGSTYVEVMKRGKVSQVMVELGLSSDSSTEITSGLNEGDVVVTSTITKGTTSSSSNSSTSPFSTLNRGGNQIMRINR